MKKQEDYMEEQYKEVEECVTSNKSVYQNRKRSSRRMIDLHAQAVEICGDAFVERAVISFLCDRRFNLRSYLVNAILEKLNYTRLKCAGKMP